MKKADLKFSFISLLLVIVIAAILIFMFRDKFGTADNQISDLMGCNSEVSGMKCACLLEENQGRALSTGEDFECPSFAVTSEHDSRCPKTCTPQTFVEDLKKAQKAYHDNDGSKVEYFGHCCRGIYED